MIYSIHDPDSPEGRKERLAELAEDKAHFMELWESASTAEQRSAAKRWLWRIQNEIDDIESGRKYRSYQIQ